MRGRLMFLAGTVVGYVLGAKAGRGRYEQIKSQADTLWHDPRVQEKVGQAQSLVSDTAAAAADKAKEKAPDVQAKLGDAASTAKAKVADLTSGSGGSGGSVGSGSGVPTEPHPGTPPVQAAAGDDDQQRGGMTPHSEDPQ